MSPVDLRGARMHRHDRAGEARRDEIVQDLRADLAALAIGADDRHHARLEERLHRRRRGRSRARRRLVREGIGHRQRQRRPGRRRARPRSVAAKPESRNTSSIRRLSPSTYGSKVSMPCSRAIARAARAAACRCRAPAARRRRRTPLPRDSMLRVPVEAGERDDATPRFDHQGRPDARRPTPPAPARRAPVSAGRPRNR